MKKTVAFILFFLPITVLAAPMKKIEVCIVAGGVWVNNSCYYMSEYDECTPTTQFIDCQGGSTSATGPGTCVVGQTDRYECDYLYQQACSQAYCSRKEYAPSPTCAMK
jgi:hypothetical protein